MRELTIYTSGRHCRSFFRCVSAIMVMGLAFQSVPLPIKAQIAPLTTAAAVVLTPLVLVLAEAVTVTPLLTAVMAFAAFALTHSVAALLVDTATSSEIAVRMHAWWRQAVALLGGVSVFIVFRITLTSTGELGIWRYVIAGALPAIAVSLLNILWGLFDLDAARAIVTTARSALVSGGYTGQFRVTGFSFEPSHFAFYVAVIVVPALLHLVKLDPLHKRWYVVLLVVCLPLVAATFSATGLLSLLAVLILGLRRRRLAVALASAGVLLVGLVVIILMHSMPPQDRYLVITAMGFWQGLANPDLARWSDSALDLVFSTIGPIISIPTSYVSLGYGLGGMSTHIADVVPEYVADRIAAIRLGEVPSLGTLAGRVLAETGVIGLALFLVIWIAALLQLRAVRREEGTSAYGSRGQLSHITGAALCGVAVGQLLKHGSFALPFFWFWLAVVDTSYMGVRNRMRNRRT